MVLRGMPARTALTVPQTTPTVTNIRMTIANVPIMILPYVYAEIGTDRYDEKPEVKVVHASTYRVCARYCSGETRVADTQEWPRCNLRK